MQKGKSFKLHYFLRMFCILMVLSPTKVAAEGIRDIQQGEILAFVDARRAVLDLEISYAPMMISEKSKREALRMRKDFFKKTIQVIDATPGISYRRYNQILLLAQKSRTISSIIQAAHLP